MTTFRRGLRFYFARLKAMRGSDNPAFLQEREDHLYTGLRKAGIPEN